MSQLPEEFKTLNTELTLEEEKALFQKRKDLQFDYFMKLNQITLNMENNLRGLDEVILKIKFDLEEKEVHLQNLNNNIKNELKEKEAFYHKNIEKNNLQEQNQLSKISSL